MGKSLGDNDIKVELDTKSTYDGDDWDDWNFADDIPDDNDGSIDA